MAKKRLSPEKARAMGEVRNSIMGDTLIYSVGNDIGPWGNAMYYLAQNGYFCLVQKAHGKPRGPSGKPRKFTYMAQRTQKRFEEGVISAAFNPRERK